MRRSARHWIRPRRRIRRDSIEIEQNGGSDDASRSQAQIQEPIWELVNSELEAVLEPTFGEGLVESGESDISEEDDDAAFGDNIHVKLFSVNGLDGEYACIGEAPLAGCTPSKFDFRANLINDKDVEENWLQTAAENLLRFVSDGLVDAEDSERQKPHAIIFLARDLGGTVLKQALCSASEDLRYEMIIKNTTHLFFFGTPHRASEEFPWHLTISNLVYNQTPRVLNRSLPCKVHRLTVPHAALASEFGYLCQQYTFTTVNYYQEKLDTDPYTTVAPKSAATLDQTGELQIGRHVCHELLADLSQPNTREVLLSSIREANDRMDTKYRACLKLLAAHDVDIALKRESIHSYEVPCIQNLLSEALAKFAGSRQGGSIARVGTEDSRESEGPGLSLHPDIKGKGLPIRDVHSVGRFFQTLDLHGWTLDPIGLASSLTTSILQQHGDISGQVYFITLSHHPSRRLPMTKADLLVSIARQYLTHHPRSFHSVQPLLENLEEALHSNNKPWKEASLWRLVRMLLGCRGPSFTFLLIFQPLDERKARPFRELTSELLSWLYQTESPCRILAIRNPSLGLSRQGTPTQGDNEDVCSEQGRAVEADFSTRLGQAIRNNPRLSGLHNHLTGALGRIRLLTLEQCIAILERHLPSSLTLPRAPQGSDGDKILLDLILESVATPVQPWLKAGLVWITHAVRPLTRSELEAVVSESFGGNTLAILLDEFQRLLPGLVLTDGETLYLASSGAVTLLFERLTKHLNHPEPGIDAIEMAGKEHESLLPQWYRPVSPPDLDIVQHCIKLLRAQYEHETRQAAETSDGDPEGQESALPTKKQELAAQKDANGASPLLSYAAENWLEHVQLWIADLESSTQKTQDFRMPNFVVEFISDQNLANWWLQLRKSPRAGRVEQMNRYNIPEIATQLGLDLMNSRDLIEVVSIVQDSSDNERGDSESSSSSLAVTLAQLGHVKALAKLDGTFFGESWLDAAFKTGADAALCHLVNSHPDFAYENRYKITSKAIALGNGELLRDLCTRWDSSYADGEFSPPLFHGIAELGSFLPQENFWHRFKTHCTAISDDKRTALHLAAYFGHSGLVPGLLAEGLDPNQKDSSGATPLLLAARHGHFTIARLLLTSHADPSIADRSRQTPLHTACANGHLDMVKLLLSHSASQRGISAKDRRRNTPLHLALANSYTDIAKVILQVRPSQATRIQYRNNATVSQKKTITISVHNGVKFSPPEVTGMTYSERSITDGHIRREESSSPPRTLRYSSELFVISASSVTVLTEGKGSKPLNLNSPNSADLTPLTLAIKLGNVEMVQSLLYYGAKAHIPDKHKRSPVHHAAARGVPKILDLLFEVPDVKVGMHDTDGVTALHLAASGGCIDIIRKLLEKGADCNARSKEDYSPLDLACERGLLSAVESMVPSCSPENLTTGFLKAASAGHVDIAKLLMDEGAQKNANAPGTGSTALHFAASNSNTRLVQALLKRRVELNCVDWLGRTPLHEAASSNAADCLELLVDAGAAVNLTDDEGISALDMAATRNYERCVAILLATNAIVEVPSTTDGLLYTSLHHSSTDIFRMVLERVSKHWSGWASPNDMLLSSLKDGVHVEDKLPLLFDHGLQHDLIIGDCGTMLHYAALWDRPGLVDVLAKNGHANPAFVHKEHGTPLQIAAENGNDNAPQIVRTLLKEGADAEQGSGKRGTPLHAAALMPYHWGDAYLEIARIILDHAPTALHREAGAYPTVLQAAIVGGTEEMINLIIDRGARLDVIAGTWGTPLHLAAVLGLQREIDLLLERGAPHLTLDTLDKGGRLPMHMTAYYANDSSFLFPVLSSQEHGPTSTDYQQRHMFHFWAGTGEKLLLCGLLEDNPDSAKDPDLDGWTPLHWACRQGNLGVIALLLDDGADKNATTNRGWRPLDVAIYHSVDLSNDSEVRSGLQYEEKDDDGNDTASHRVLPNVDTLADEEETLPAEPAKRSTDSDEIGYRCDSCFCKIYGPRYGCNMCYEFDMCFKCFRHIKEIHYKGHTFNQFDTSGNTVKEGICYGCTKDSWEKDQDTEGGSEEK